MSVLTGFLIGAGIVTLLFTVVEWFLHRSDHGRRKHWLD